MLPHDILLPPSPFTEPYLPEWVHVVCVTERARLIVDEMREIRHTGLGPNQVGKGWKGKMIWEPLSVGLANYLGGHLG